MSGQPDIDRLAEKGRDLTREYLSDNEPARCGIDGVISELVALARELEGELAEVAVAPDDWMDENGHLRGYEQGDDPRDAIDRLGFIYGSLKGEKQPDRSVALEALRLTEAQIERAEAAEARVAELERALENGDRLLSQAGRRVVELEGRYEVSHRRVMDYAAELDRARERVAELAEALSIARDLLAGEGYDTDPDYTQEWATVSGPLAGDGGGA